MPELDDGLFGVNDENDMPELDDGLFGVYQYDKMRKKDKKKKKDRRQQNPNSDTFYNYSLSGNVELKSKAKIKDIITLAVEGTKYNCALLSKKGKKQICSCSHRKQIDAQLFAEIIFEFMRRNKKHVTIYTEWCSELIAYFYASQNLNNSGFLSCMDALTMLKIMQNPMLLFIKADSDNNSTISEYELSDIMRYETVANFSIQFYQKLIKTRSKGKSSLIFQEFIDAIFDLRTTDLSFKCRYGRHYEQTRLNVDEYFLFDILLMLIPFY